ncbi:MAG: spore coat associated protein CotJA [Betaproteobacteria bacterium]
MAFLCLRQAFQRWPSLAEPPLLGSHRMKRLWDKGGETGVETRKARLARAYIPFQVWGPTFPWEEGLAKGTIFPELYQPYHPHEYLHRPHEGR